ncbi:MAG TPA: hypothetical protein VMB24_03540 [Dehalococcoidales bacterium]|nr:hypothetical protein [Dehalococcoidales bacterium]
MAKRKYEKYIIYKAEAPKDIPEYRHESAEVKSPGMTRLASLVGNAIPEAPHMGAMWFLPRPPNNGTKPGVEAHTHEFDEVLGFYGGDPNNPDELYGEVEFWLGDEKYLLTKSCIIFVPKGLKHCPLFIRKLEKPMLHMGWSPVAPT